MNFNNYYHKLHKRVIETKCHPLFYSHPRSPSSECPQCSQLTGTTPWRATTFSDNSCENENSMNGKGWSIFISFHKAFPKQSLAPIESPTYPKQKATEGVFLLTRYFYVRQCDFSFWLLFVVVVDRCCCYCRNAGYCKTSTTKQS